MFIDKVTLIGPAPYGGTYTTIAHTNAVALFISRGYTIMRQWTVKVNADGTRESLPLA
jgi:hypothetical protein